MLRASQRYAEYLQVLGDAGFEVSTAIVDASSRSSVHALVEKATAAGEVTRLIHAAGVSPSQAPPTLILKVDVDQATMGVAAENVFEGAALGTKWSDPNKRSAYFGTFSY
jgi:hypothetical protein